jgi:multiple sugar transport system substrate-binding protein
VVRRSRLVLPLVLVLAAAVTACTDDDEPGPGQSTSAPPVATKVDLTFGVWGSERETAVYQRVLDGYNAKTEEASVKLRPYPTHDDLMAALEGGNVPDVFLVSRGDLAELRARELNRPIGDLLDERDVDFGDGYSRPALEAFAGDRDLQCMPYGISPMVIYYNRDLVDFAAMEQRGLDVPTVDDVDLTKKPSWTLEQFQAAAEYASRPRRGVGGFYVAPTTTRARRWRRCCPRCATPS